MPAWIHAASKKAEVENHWATCSRTGGEKTSEGPMQFKSFHNCKSAVLPNGPEAGQINGVEDQCCWQLLASTEGASQTPL